MIVQGFKISCEDVKFLSFLYAPPIILLAAFGRLGAGGTELRFEICGWLVNTCKSNFTPAENCGHGRRLPLISEA